MCKHCRDSSTHPSPPCATPPTPQTTAPQPRPCRPQRRPLRPSLQATRQRVEQGAVDRPSTRPLPRPAVTIPVDMERGRRAGRTRPRPRPSPLRPARPILCTPVALSTASTTRTTTFSATPLLCHHPRAWPPRCPQVHPMGAAATLPAEASRVAGSTAGRALPCRPRPSCRPLAAAVGVCLCPAPSPLVAPPRIIYSSRIALLSVEMACLHTVVGRAVAATSRHRPSRVQGRTDTAGGN